MTPEVVGGTLRVAHSSGASSEANRPYWLTERSGDFSVAPFGAF
jgi:hypothetical protein